MSLAPIQAFIIALPDNDLLEGRIAAELAALSDVGLIRIIDAVFVTREGDEVAVLSISELDAEERADLRTVTRALLGLGLAGEDGAIAGAILGADLPDDAPSYATAVGLSLADEIPSGSSGMVVVIEHVWAAPLRDAVLDAGGMLVSRRVIDASTLVSAGALLAALDEGTEDVD